MCGIATIYAYRHHAPIHVPELIAIRDHMAARGPDAAGLWLDEERKVGLGHRRLAIVDTSPQATQPMSSPDGRIQLVFNGEIYNFLELRAELESLGHTFRTQSDTEVLIHAYLEWKEDAIRRLRGMFAFALWDDERQGLLLARDHLGIKPLYYHDDGRTFRCASQVKAVLAGQGIENRLEPAGAVGFFLWGCVPEPYTLTKGIQSLPAGHWLWVDRRGSFGSKRYFDPEPALALREDGASNDAMVALIRNELSDSVSHHLVADVPIGIFLSAGIDSSVIAALAAEGRPTPHAPQHRTPLHCLTLGFDEYAGTERDESILARKTAAFYGMSHSTTTISRGDFEQDLPRLLAAMDLPSIDGVNTWFIAKAASQAGLKVALSGLGADELFGGYPSFRNVPAIVNQVGPIARIPGLGRGFRVLTGNAIARWTSPKYAGLLEYGGTYGGAYLLRRALYMPWELPQVLDPEIVRLGWNDLQPVLAADAMVQKIGHDRARVASLELQLYMRNMLLRDTDWASMAHSVEVRTPFVDVRLFNSLAPFVGGLTPPAKLMLPKMPEKALPAEVTQRRKTGFSVPIQQWIEDRVGGDRGLRGWARFLMMSFTDNSAADGPSIENSSTSLPLTRSGDAPKTHVRFATNG